MPDVDPCATVLRDLYAYLDGTLSPLRTAEVETHLADCLSCMTEVEATRPRGR